MIQKRALITGITGQDGSYLADFLLNRDYEVWGIVRRSSSSIISRGDRLNGSASNRGLHLCFADLQDFASISRVMRLARPHEVYNLGAQSHVHASFNSPVYTSDVTGLGALRLLDCIRTLGLGSKFFQASSSELYGMASECPQTERTPFHPRNPYGTAKAFAFYSTQNYRECYGLFAVNGILFNHESPRRGEEFVTRKISRAVGKIAAGQRECLSLGSLDSRRDWGFAGDYVAAMWLMLQHNFADDYIVATGETHTVREFCDLAFAQIQQPLTWEGDGVDEIGLSPDGTVRVRVDAKFFRPPDANVLCGDFSKAKRCIGWSPSVQFERLVEMMVEHDVRLAANEVQSLH